jgi:hypothetical protein
MSPPLGPAPQCSLHREPDCAPSNANLHSPFCDGRGMTGGFAGEGGHSFDARSGLIIGEGLLVVPEIQNSAAMAPPYAGSATSGFARSEARMRDS